MDTQRIILYTIFAAIMALLLFLNNYSRMDHRGVDLTFTDRSQQSEFARGTGLFRDAREHQKWLKEQEAWAKEHKIGD